MVLLKNELKKLFGIRYVAILLLLLFLSGMITCYISVREQTKIYEPNKTVCAIYDDFLYHREELDAYREELIEYGKERSETLRRAMEEYEKYEEEDPTDREKPSKGQAADLENLFPTRKWKYTGSENAAYELKYVEMPYKTYDSVVSYPSDIESVLAQRRLALYTLEEGSFNRLYTEETIRQYEKLQKSGVGIGFEHVYGWDLCFENFYLTVFYLAAVLVVACAVLLQDKSCGFYQILSASKRGRKRTLSVKLFLILLLTAVIAVIFYGAELFAVCMQCGLSSPFNAIQAFSAFRYAPYDVTVLEYFFIQLGMKILVGCFFAFFVSFAAAILNNYLSVYCAGLLLLGLNFAAYRKNYVDPSAFLKINNLFSVSSYNAIFSRYRAYALFGTPVDDRLLLLLLYGSLTFVFAVCCFFFYHKVGSQTGGKLLPRLRVLLLKLPNRKKKTKKTRSLCLTVYELKKQFSGVWMILVALLLLFCSLYNSFCAFKVEPSWFNAAYNQYMDNLAGMPEVQAGIYLKNEQQRLLVITDKKKSMEARYESGEITDEEFSDYMAELREAEALYDVITKINSGNMSRVRRHNARGKTTAYLLHDIGYNVYFTRDPDVFLYMFILILCVGIFSVEYSGNSRVSNFRMIQSATKKGRKATFFSKLLSSFLVTTVGCLISVGGELFFFLKSYGLPDSDLSIESVAAFDGLSVPLDIGQYLALQLAVRYIACILLMLFAVSLSQFCRKIIPAFTLTALLTIVPHTLVFLGVPDMITVDFLSLFSLTPLLKHSAVFSPGVLGGTKYLLICFAIFAVLAVLTALGAYKSFSGIGFSFIRGRKSEKKRTTDRKTVL